MIFNLICVNNMLFYMPLIFKFRDMTIKSLYNIHT